MRNVRLFLFLIATCALGVAAPAYGQNGPPPQEAANDERPEPGRPNLLAELGLSPEQVQQIRRMNQARRPIMAAAQRRLREANRDLDMSIYGETVSDADFHTRLKEFHLAQADVARLRFEGELAVRKVLTADQLVKFRELRRRFAEMRNENMRDRPRRRGGQQIPPPRDIPQRPIN